MIPAGWAVIALLLGMGIGWGLRSLRAVDERDKAWDLGWKRGHQKGWREGNEVGFSSALDALERAVGDMSDTDVGRRHP